MAFASAPSAVVPILNTKGDARLWSFRHFDAKVCSANHEPRRSHREFVDLTSDLRVPVKGQQHCSTAGGVLTFNDMFTVAVGVAWCRRLMGRSSLADPISDGNRQQQFAPRQCYPKYI